MSNIESMCDRTRPCNSFLHRTRQNALFFTIANQTELGSYLISAIFVHLLAVHLYNHALVIAKFPDVISIRSVQTRADHNSCKALHNVADKRYRPGHVQLAPPRLQHARFER